MVSLTTVSLLKERSNIFSFVIRSLRALSSMYSSLLWLTFNNCKLYSSLHKKKNLWRWFWDKSNVFSASRLVEQSRKLSISFPLKLRSVTSCRLILFCIFIKKSSFVIFRNERSTCNASLFLILFIHIKRFWIIQWEMTMKSNRRRNNATSNAYYSNTCTIEQYWNSNFCLFSSVLHVFIENKKREGLSKHNFRA